MDKTSFHFTNPPHGHVIVCSTIVPGSSHFQPYNLVFDLNVWVVFNRTLINMQIVLLDGIYISWAGPHNSVCGPVPGRFQ